MTLEEAQQAVEQLQEWAKDRWGIETERKYVCPLDGYAHDYEGYCSDDGRKLVEKQVEPFDQKWKYNLSDFISMPEYPVEPKEQS